MKNNIFSTFLAIVLNCACFFSFALAQAGDMSFEQESITNFNSSITVNIDNSVDVVETIDYDTGGEQRHGIYRDIYPYSSAGKKMSIENISVADGNNLSYIFTTSNSGPNIRIKIGDPNQTFTGQKVYVIKYHAARAAAQFKDFDEIYWNVTGNEWKIPIYKTHASIVLPAGAGTTQSACYYGLKGSANKCFPNNSQNGINTFDAPSTLNIGEGFTVAVGFPKGIVAAYSASDSISSLYETYLPWLVAILLPILTFIFSIIYWYKKGRDPKGTGVIVPQYDVPDELTPMEVAGIINEKVRTDNISAEIIYLATRGYLKITLLEERILGLFKSTDYELSKLKDSSDLTNEFDRKLFKSLFHSKQTVKLSELKNIFYKDATLVIDSVLDSLLSKGYYKNLGRMKNAGNGLVALLFISVFASIGGGILSSNLIFRENPLPIIAGIFASIIIYVIIFYFSPAKTEKGVAAKEYVLGLKDYLRIAEKDRLLFHNAPEKKPEVFEKLLPYAMVLGVANIWAKEFEGIYTTPPSWYSGPSGVPFNAMMFNHSLANFSSFASSSMTSSPSGSGSGGGGFSGGGGGGGGGGGW